MAKGSRASSIKTNNSKLKSRVFGPIETERTARLSAKLLELAAQPRASQKVEEASMDVEEDANQDGAKQVDHQAMEMDGSGDRLPATTQPKKNRIEKRRKVRSKSSIVFPAYKDGKKTGAVRKKK